MHVLFFPLKAAICVSWTWHKSLLPNAYIPFPSALPLIPHFFNVFLFYPAETKSWDLPGQFEIKAQNPGGFKWTSADGRHDYTSSSLQLWVLGALTNTRQGRASSTTTSSAQFFPPSCHFQNTKLLYFLPSPQFFSSTSSKQLRQLTETSQKPIPPWSHHTELYWWTANKGLKSEPVHASSLTSKHVFTT